MKKILFSLACIPGVFLSLVAWVLASWSLCGISGCDGGGFGVSYDPLSVQLFLILSGLVAAATPITLYFVTKARSWIVVAVVLAIGITFVGGLIIGAGLDGYPRNHQT